MYSENLFCCASGLGEVLTKQFYINLSVYNTVVLVVSDSANEIEFAPVLERIGFRLHIREPEWHEHRMFKGPENDVNLHVFSVSCPEVERMLAFRDWLRANDTDRDLYADCKQTLAQQQ